ncbi:MAG: hypothetical protein QOI21_972 [Actinomycetota bacterium]|nr:hypothetical protein [Actinomycetota bacterium]
MADNDNPYAYDEAPATTQPAKRGIDVMTLIAGIVTLAASGYILGDGASWMPDFNLRWVMAGAAVLIGVLMLAASLRNNRRP